MTLKKDNAVKGTNDHALRWYVYCTSREYYWLGLSCCPNDGYVNRFQTDLLSLRCDTWEDLMRNSPGEEVLLAVLLFPSVEEVISGRSETSRRHEFLSAVEARNKSILDQFPSGILARRLKEPRRVTNVQYVRSTTEAGVVVLLDPAAPIDSLLLQAHGVPEGEVQKALAGLPNSLELIEACVAYAEPPQVWSEQQLRKWQALSNQESCLYPHVLAGRV